MKKVNTMFPYRVGDQVWFFQDDSPNSELQVKPIYDISLNGKISVHPMKDGRPQYYHNTTFFFHKNDAVEFMIGTLSAEITAMRDTMKEYMEKISHLDAERYATP